MALVRIVVTPEKENPNGSQDGHANGAENAGPDPSWKSGDDIAHLPCIPVPGYAADDQYDQNWRVPSLRRGFL